jgi:hypothetical protein
MNDEKHTGQAGDASDGKDLQRADSSLELKTRRARLLQKIREDRNTEPYASTVGEAENATAGDDRYTDALARYGIEI